MTSKEALSRIKNISIYEDMNPSNPCSDYIEYKGDLKSCHKEEVSIIERDITLVENLKNVLSKVTRVVYQPIWNIEYKVSEAFDIEAFKDILDQLGYTLVKKEEK